MGYGNGMAGGKQLAYRPAKRKVKFSKEFSSFYTNADAQSGDCKVTSSSRGLTHEDGTVTYKKGNSIIKFTSDGGSSFLFALKSMISEGLSRGAWVITLP